DHSRCGMRSRVVSRFRGNARGIYESETDARQHTCDRVTFAGTSRGRVVRLLAPKFPWVERASHAIKEGRFPNRPYEYTAVWKPPPLDCSARFHARNLACNLPL